MTVFIVTLGGAKKEIVAPFGATVEEFKNIIQTQEGTLADQQRLIFNGKQLEDSRELLSYGISSGSTIHLVLRLRGC